MPSKYLILCCPLLLPPSFFHSIRVFSGESVLHTRCPKYWSFRFSISPSNDYSGLIFFRMDCLQCTRLLSSLLSPRVCLDSCLLNWWSYPTISSSVAPFYFCLQIFLVSGSFPMSWLFAPGSQSIGASDSASVLPMNIQGWFPFGLTGLVSLKFM